MAEEELQIEEEGGKKSKLMLIIIIVLTVKNIFSCLFKNSTTSLTVENLSYLKDCLLCPPSSVHVMFVRTQGTS